MRKIILAGLATAAVMASPAFAQAASFHHVHPQGYVQDAGGAYAQSPHGAYGARARVAPDAGLGGDYVGTDPDANVQLNLLRDSQDRD